MCSLRQVQRERSCKSSLCLREFSLALTFNDTTDTHDDIYGLSENRDRNRDNYQIVSIASFLAVSKCFVLSGIFSPETVDPMTRSVVPVFAFLWGAGFVFVLAIVLGRIVGFNGGAICAFIYNIAASHVGPIEVDLEVKA
jgi:hypothetical protein